MCQAETYPCFLFFFAAMLSPLLDGFTQVFKNYNLFNISSFPGTNFVWLIF